MRKRKDIILPADPQELFIPHYSADEVEVIGKIKHMLDNSMLNNFSKQRVIECIKILLKREEKDPEW